MNAQNVDTLINLNYILIILSSILSSILLISNILKEFGFKIDEIPIIKSIIQLVPLEWSLIALLILIIIYQHIHYNYFNHFGGVPIGLKTTSDRKEKIDEFEYAGVKWDVYISYNEYESRSEILEDIENRLSLKFPPKCPKCNVELEERKIWILGYIWSCVRCSFKKWSGDSFFRVQEKGERICRADVIKEKESDQK